MFKFVIAALIAASVVGAALTVNAQTRTCRTSCAFGTCYTTCY